MPTSTKASYFAGSSLKLRHELRMSLRVWA